MTLKSSIQEEILSSCYWEHFKYAKDLALIYPDINHPKRKKAEAALEEIRLKIKQ